MQKGFTLIETLIYIVLLSVILGASLGISSQILTTSGKNGGKIATQQEADFVLRKIDWALTGAITGSVNVPNSSRLEAKNGTLIFIFDNSTGVLSLNSIPLNTSNAKITALIFDLTSHVIKTTFTMNGANFESAKQLR